MLVRAVFARTHLRCPQALLPCAPGRQHPARRSALLPQGSTNVGDQWLPTQVGQVVVDGVGWVAEGLVTNPGQLWSACAASLRGQVSEATWKAWFEGIRPMATDER